MLEMGGKKRNEVMYLSVWVVFCCCADRIEWREEKEKES